MKRNENGTFANINNDTGRPVSRFNKIEKTAWRRYHSMLDRCYNTSSSSYKYYGELGVTVCNEWRDSFASYLSWFKDNYEEGLFVDKDILPNPDKVYSPDTCLFVLREINNRFSKRTRIEKELPEGANRATHGDKFYSSISINNKKIYLLRATTSMWECSKVYLDKKYEIIEDMLKRASSSRLIAGLKYQLYLIEKKIAIACCEMEKEK